jgi:hypothetical protein
MNYLRTHGYHTVGVLKFGVKKGGSAPSLNAGTLNAKMAARLENAMILLDDPSSPINILHDPGRAVATLSRGATHRSTQGRRGLFDHSYPVAWGDQRKKPDAFLTGDVLLEKDMKHLAIVVRAFSAKTPEKVDEVLRIKNVPTDRNVLASVGQSFVLPRGLKKRGPGELDEAAADDAAERDDVATDPLNDSDNPVKLEVFYDDKPVTLEPDTGSPGEIRVAGSRKAVDPKVGQVVKFVITNTSSDVIGVVLAVNGKSTLFMEDLTSKAPGSCAKWILAAGESYTIAGFYTSEDGKQVRPFKVLSDEESARSDLSGDLKGVFSLFAFRKVAGDSESALNITDEGGADLGDSLVLSGVPGKRGFAEVHAATSVKTHTVVRNGTLVAAPSARRRAPAKHARQKGSRGLVVEGEESSSGAGFKRSDTKFDPEPSVSISIRYYNGPTPAGE